MKKQLFLIGALASCAVLMGSSVAQASTVEEAPADLAGVLTNPDGSAWGSGELVEAYVWPEERPADGEEFPLILVGQTTTLDGGEFALELDEALIAETGTSVELVASNEEGVVTYALDAEEALAEESQVQARSFAAPVYSDIDQNPRALSLQAVPGEPSDDAPLLSARGTPVGPACTASAVTTINNVMANVVDISVKGSGISGKAGYSTAKETTLGWGTSVSGSNGTFSAGGSSTMSGDTSVSVSKGANQKVKVRQAFQYKKYKVSCPRSSTNKVSWRVQPQFPQAGSDNVARSAYIESNCTPLGSNTTIRIKSGKGTQTSAGLSVAGSSLSASTNYSTSVWVEYTNTTGSSRSLCGTHGIPNATSNNKGSVGAK